MKGGTPGAEPRRFLAGLRRRHLTASFLALCLPAAILNESYRWAAYGADRFLGFEIPYLNTGPYFLLAAFFLTFRRWSLRRTAAFADRRLSFRDRLASFIDFGDRDDLSPEIRRAQASEVARRLGSVSAGTVVPLRLLHLAGPALLVASLMYPLFFFSFSSPPPFFGPSADGGSGSSGPGGSAENVPDIPAPPLEREPGDTGPVEHDERDNSGEDSLAETRGNAGGLEDADSRRDGSSSPPSEDPALKPPGLPPENPFEREASELETIVSIRTGLQLSTVVDPVFAASDDERGRDPVLPGGTMSFRLIPKTASGEENGASTADALAPSMRIDVDFKNIPERYRHIVQRYFTDLERITTKGRL